MSLNPKIFKAYDIRGIVPQEMDEDAAYRIGQAVVKFTKAKTLVVGKDMRESTPKLFEAFAKGALSQGADIIDVGMTTTPMFYFAVGDYELHDAGVMVTASHNPKEYNGFKLVYGDVQPIGAESGIYDLRDLALAGPYPAQKEGQVVETSIREAYLDRVFRGVDVKKIKPFNIVVDCGNGMEGIILKDVFARLPQCKMHGMFLEPDGSFPNHEANPLKEETLDALKKEVRARKADLGVAFDGDADRIGFVDENGEIVRGDIMEAILAARILARHPGATILYAVNQSMVVAEEIERHGGKAVMSRVGHGVVKPHMRRVDAEFAGEFSMHYFYKSFYTAECTDLTMLLLLEILSERGVKLSELVRPLMRYWHSGEINSRVEDKEGVLAKLEETYGHEASAITKIDGLRMDFRDEARPEEDWWFNVRPSNTEPLLRLTMEAKNKAKMEQKRDELLALIRS